MPYCGVWATHRWVAGIALGITIIFLAAGEPAHAAGDKPMVMDAWVRAAPPNMKIHAGYLTVGNPKDAAVDLIGAESPQYDKAELHFSKVEAGVATMARQRQITIAAKGRLVMAPGGFHVMLIDPKAPVRAGDSVDITLRFADGAAITVKAPVKKASGKPSGMHHHGETKHQPKTH